MSDRARRTRVKICGLTSAADARLCQDLGADYLGMVFVPGVLRQVSTERAQEIRAAAPGAQLVGVFMDAAPAVVLATAGDCGLDLIQLHGQETPAMCRELGEATGLLVIKVFRAGELDDAEWGGVAEAVPYLLFDLAKNAADAETAQPQLWAEAAAAVRAGRQVFIAGGLTADTVSAAVTEIAPFAVDVSSGVESESGRKDPELVARFIQEVENAGVERASK